MDKFKFLNWSVVAFSLLMTTSLQAKTMNGFDLSGGLLPMDEIFQGGPPRDGIPAIDNPQFVTAAQMQELGELEPSDLVLGVSVNGIHKAYPIRILNWHEIVNDNFAEQPVVITFCPLCGSGMAFEAQLDGIDLDFGVSGLLYNSDVLLFDRQTQSLWSQIEKQSVTGNYQSRQLVDLAVQNTTWQRWREQYPDTQVLSFDTGYRRSYRRDPYAGYENSANTFFPVKFRAMGLHPKEKVLGLEHQGLAKAWPLVELAKAKLPLLDNIGDMQVMVHYDESSHTGHITDLQGQLLPAVSLFWFAWAAFHDDTLLYR